MKKFLRYILLFSLPVLVAAVAAEILLRHIPNEYTYKAGYLDKRGDSVQALILGSSHSYFDLNPAYFHVRAFNAAQPSQSVDYDYEIVKKYIDKLPNLAYIIIPVSYNSFYSRLSTHIESWRIKNYMLYCDMHTSRKLTDNSEILGGKFEFNLDRLWHYYVAGDYKINCSNLGWGMDYPASKSHDLDKTGLAAAKRQHVVTKDEDNFAGNKADIQMIIDLAAKKGVHVILFTAPGYVSYVTALHKDQLDLTTGTAEQFARNNNNVSYFNFLIDPSFRKGDFFDGDHLNNIGAEKLSHKLDSLIMVQPGTAIASPVKIDID